MPSFTVHVRINLPNGNAITGTRETEAETYEEACERAGLLMQEELTEAGFPCTYALAHDPPSPSDKELADYGKIPF